MFLNYSLLAIGITLGVFGQLCLKQGMLILKVKDRRGLLFFVSALTNSFVLLGLLFYGISTVIWLFILSRVELSFAYPMISVGYILVVFFCKIFFGEVIHPVRWAGVFAITAGVYLITRSI